MYEGAAGGDVLERPDDEDSPGQGLPHARPGARRLPAGDIHEEPGW